MVILNLVQSSPTAHFGIIPQNQGNMTKLNARQQEAVRYIDGPSLVLAGAGSGKTSVITQKIIYLIQQCGIPARHIAALTFTNKAAREMKERVGSLLKGSMSKGLTISTFHNLGLNIIRREHKLLGFKPGFSIFDSEDARSLLKELMLKEGDLDVDHLDRVQHQISNWKNDLQTPDHALSKAQSAGEEYIAHIYKRYNSALKAYNAVDFDDLILIPAQLFTGNAEALARWQSKIRHLLVDEYQDTNTSQYLLVKLLVGNRHNLTVVGDDDQSIYAWRGAKPENLFLLQQDFPNLKVIKLEQNYRSTSRILKSANTLIANNPHVFEKALWSEVGLGEPLRLIRCANEEAEAERVATEIFMQRQSRNASYGDFAILYRGNHQSRLLELKLQQHQIPYSISGGTSFFAKTEIKDILAYLRLLVNPDDDNAFLRVINTPRRQIGTSTLETLGRYATEREIGLLAACDELGIQGHLPLKNIERLQRFSRWLSQIAQQSRQQDPASVIRAMIEDIDYESWLHQNASSPKVAEKRYENIEFLLKSITTIIDRDNQESGDGSLENAINKLLLRDMLDRQSDQEDNLDQVQMMTLHASKGLEFPYVFMVGMEEDLLPHRSSIEEDNIEEERRLTYVGITRAKRALHMTLASKRRQFGEVWDTSPSRFLDELPDEDIEREGFGDNCPVKNQSKGRQTLDSLLDSL